MRTLALVVLFACKSSAASRIVAVEAQPTELAAGDLDVDGRQDLVIAHDDGSVVVRLQRAGTWATPAWRCQACAHLLGLGDVDADGKLDLVTTTHDSGDVGVLRGRGDGRFEAITHVRAVAVAKPHNHGLVVGDLDRDGDADVAVVDQEARQLVVLLSNGHALEAQPPIALPAQPYPLAAGDLDGNGTLDLVVPLVGGREVAVLLGDGGGRFGSPHLFATGIERPYGVAIGDVDADGVVDVVVSHDDTRVVVVLSGDGKGGLAKRRTIRLPGRIGRPIVADVDGDGTLDLVGAGSGRLVIVDRGLARIRTEQPVGGWRVIAAQLDDDLPLELAAPDPEVGGVRVW